MRNAVLTKGEIQLSSKASIYIPMKDGYISFDVRSEEEVTNLLKHVADEYANSLLQSKTISLSAEWKPIDVKNSNSGVYKIVSDPLTNITYWRSCSCGYCCW